MVKSSKITKEQAIDWMYSLFSDFSCANVYLSIEDMIIFSEHLHIASLEIENKNLGFKINYYKEIEKLYITKKNVAGFYDMADNNDLKLIKKILNK